MQTFSLNDFLLRSHGNPHRQSKSKGTWAELMACSWLIEHGYEVFRNVSQFGWCDVVAWKPGEIKLIDVKFVSVSPNTGKLTGNKHLRNDKQEQAGVIPLFVTDDGVCDFSLEALKQKYDVVGRYNQGC
jgi:hypothetical protein